MKIYSTEIKYPEEIKEIPEENDTAEDKNNGFNINILFISIFPILPFVDLIITIHHLKKL